MAKSDIRTGPTRERRLDLINTPLQRGGVGIVVLFNRFNSFPCVCRAVRNVLGRALRNRMPNDQRNRRSELMEYIKAGQASHVDFGFGTDSRLTAPSLRPLPRRSAGNHGLGSGKSAWCGQIRANAAASRADRARGLCL